MPAASRLAYTDPNREPFIRCRTLGHAWDDYESNWTPVLGLPLTVRCERCAMERRDTVVPHTGALITRHYTRPAGYQYTKDDPAPTRSQFRLMLLNLEHRRST